jgi:hydrogenase expression/formation protein HypD
LNFLDKFRDPELCRRLLDLIHKESKGVRFMEVCGTHTVSIFQSGIHTLLPDNVVHLTGPGCPVCVTHDREVAAYLELAARPGVTIATFGDLMKVPGPKGRNLKTAQADGADVRVVYSPFDSLELARKLPDRQVVFLGIGFETTAPAVAATLKAAREQKLANFTVLPFHKLVPPALRGLLSDPDMRIEGFILPGHVSAVIGLEPYKFLGDDCGLPAAITGFEPLDLLQALLFLVRQKNTGGREVVNQYRRLVADAGNPKAMQVMYEVFEPADALWRGIGTIPGSGLAIREEYAEHDAFRALDLTLPEVPPLPGCRCGEVLKGKMRPDQCPLFKKACTPATPVGPCMVSTEGSCAAYFKYQLDA